MFVSLTHCGSLDVDHLTPVVPIVSSDTPSSPTCTLTKMCNAGGAVNNYKLYSSSPNITQIYINKIMTTILMAESAAFIPTIIIIPWIK